MKTVLVTILLFLNTFLSVSAQKNDELLKPERVYLHTDRNIYIAGEHLFYTLYLHGSPGQISNFAYLLLRDRHNHSAANVRLEINNQIAFGSLFLSDTLSSGIYQIVCYTNCMKNEGEEAYFYKEIIIVNRFDEKMNLFTGPGNAAASDTSFAQNTGIIKTTENLIIHLNKLEFDQREKISFSLESNFLPDDSIAHLSVSISEILPGIPVEPSISEYFGNSHKNSDMGVLNRNQCSFVPEINGPVMQGKVLPMTLSDSINTNARNPIKNYTVLVSTVDSIVNMQFTTTDSLGSFSLILNPYYNGKELIVRLKRNVNSTIFTDDKFSIIQQFTPSGLFNVAGLKDYIIRTGRIAQIQKFYREQTAIITEKEFLPSKTIPRVFYKQYSTIFPSDFLELEDFAEISKEIVPLLKVRKIDGKFVSGYQDLQDQTHINIEPTIFLDGVPIDDVNQIINLGSSKIKRIESLPETRFYGEISFSGILAIFSKDLEINNIQFKTPAIRYQALSSQSYTKPEPFKPTDNPNHFPDLRQLLLWEPEIILKKNEKKQIECYASDLQGIYRINIQGISFNGSTVNGSAVFIIQSKSK